MLSKLQIEQYENDGYVVPDFKMPEDILNKIEDRHDELLKKQFVTSHKENHSNVAEVFDLIDQIYQKGKSDGKTEKENFK